MSAIVYMLGMHLETGYRLGYGVCFCSGVFEDGTGNGGCFINECEEDYGNGNGHAGGNCDREGLGFGDVFSNSVDGDDEGFGYGESCGSGGEDAVSLDFDMGIWRPSK